MFDLGWSEMLLIGIVALIVVGPKELPGLFRSSASGSARRAAWRGSSRAPWKRPRRRERRAEIDRTIRAATRTRAVRDRQLRETALGESKSARCRRSTPGAR
jgi:sec-independent protein translocase protein TatB